MVTRKGHFRAFFDIELSHFRLQIMATTLDRLSFLLGLLRLICCPRQIAAEQSGGSTPLSFLRHHPIAPTHRIRHALGATYPTLGAGGRKNSDWPIRRPLLTARPGHTFASRTIPLCRTFLNLSRERASYPQRSDMDLARRHRGAGRWNRHGNGAMIFATMSGISMWAAVGIIASTWMGKAAAMHVTGIGICNDPLGESVDHHENESHSICPRAHAVRSRNRALAYRVTDPQKPSRLTFLGLRPRLEPQIFLGMTRANSTG